MRIDCDIPVGVFFFCLVKFEIFLDINKWFKSNLLSLQFSVTQCLEFRTRNFNDNINVCYNNNRIFNTTHTKFWGLIIDGTFSWKYHSDRIMSEVNLACLAVKSFKSMLSEDIFRMVYFSYIHSIIT